MPKAKELNDEIRLLLGHAMELPKSVIVEWLKGLKIPHSGTKEVQQGRLREALLNRDIQPQQITAFLDQNVPWGKQHVYLLGEHNKLPGVFRDKTKLKQLLDDHNVAVELNEAGVLLLPVGLELHQIQHSVRGLRVTAIERRDGTYRHEEQDFEDTVDGIEYEFHAFRKEILRGYIVFEWDFLKNHAMIQVSQLPSHWRYEDARDRLMGLVPWVPFGGFGTVDFARAVRVLHEEEERGGKDVTSHSIEYQTPGNRRVAGKHTSAGKTFVGDPTTDAVMAQVRTHGTARQANLWWHAVPKATDPVHTYVHAGDRRVNFPVGYDERTVRHVLQELRR
jgi:hypothetical protein